MKGFLREAILAGAMALSGPGPLDEADLHEVDRQHAVQVEYLDKFRREVETFRTPEAIADPSGISLINPMTAKEFVARAESYANCVWGNAVNLVRKKAVRSGVFVAERRVHRLPLSEHDYCKVCIDESSKGWQNLGVLREIGDSPCGFGCDCRFQWRDADGVVYDAPKGRHNPKGYAA